MSAAFAGYVNNYADWKRLSQTEKESYAMGIFDGYSTVYSKTADENAHKLGVAACLKEKSINSRLASELISKGYDDLKTWGDPPVASFLKGVLGMCRSEIDKVRRANGLPALKP